MKKCEKCEKQHDGSYGSGRFCCMICARSFATSKNRKATSEKVSKAMKRRVYNPRNTEKILSYDKCCTACNKHFSVTWCGRNQKFCSRSCSAKWQYHPENPDYEKNMKRARRAGRKSAQVQKESRRSKNEIHFANMCKKKFQKVLCNEPMFEKWDADVILPNQKIAILWNGVWHNRKLFEGHNLKQVKSRDKLKLGAINRCGYQSYIINDPGKEDVEFVENQFEKFMKWAAREV